MSVKLGNTTIAGISRETKLNAHSLLDFKWTDHILNEMSWLRADTFSWQSGDVYTSVYNLLVAEYENGTEETEGSITFKRSSNGYKITTDESGVSALFNDTGVAWYYILDTENRRFKLPRTNYGFTGLRDSVGNYVPESLPNITGSIVNAPPVGISNNYGESWTNPSGALSMNQSKCSRSYNDGGSGVASNVNATLDFNASRSSSTYQDNAPVQQRATQMYLYFYVGEFSQTATEQTAGLNAELFNGKADISASNLNTQGKSLISSLGMPSSRNISLTMGASDSDYEAPANGYFMLYAQYNSGTNTCVEIYDPVTSLGMRHWFGTNDAINGAGRLMLPRLKGQIGRIYFNGSLKNVDFRFIYAEGEN